MDSRDRSKRVLAALVREYIARASRCPRRCSSARPGSACRRRRSATSSPASRTTASSSSPTPRPAGFRPIAAIASTWTCCSRPKRSTRTATAVEARLRRDSSAALVDSVLSQASHVVSQASRHVGFAVRPAHEAAVFDRVEFIPLSASRVLVVIVASGGHVIQKVIDVGEIARRRRSARRRRTT